ncbi:hypothetical protein FACS1894217_13130 [Clostridia bacterium]|nr:hypothetical protein FACS1894202_09660 [Clostridia bacterium]GHV09260.1 hypothetical protein FACS1894217_13130 [Clostridia bacterium]
MTENKGILPFDVIEAAASGDADALDTVLCHYAGYITVLSTKRLFDEYGNPRLYVDETLRRRLETKLITKILTFDIADKAA